MKKITNTQNTRCFPESQVNEWFKGMKQGEYLKVLQDKTEKALDKAQTLITEQKSMIAKQNDIITGQEKIINTNKYVADQDAESKNAQIDQLNNNYKILEIESKQKGKKKFWNGVVIGGVSVSVVGVGLLLLTR